MVCLFSFLFSCSYIRSQPLRKTRFLSVVNIVGLFAAHETILLTLLCRFLSLWYLRLHYYVLASLLIIYCREKTLNCKEVISRLHSACSFALKGTTYSFPKLLSILGYIFFLPLIFFFGEGKKITCKII